MHGEIISLNARETFLQRRAATQSGAVCAYLEGVYVGGGGGGGARCQGGGQVVERSALMGSARLYPCSVVLPVKSNKWQL